MIACILLGLPSVSTAQVASTHSTESSENKQEQPTVASAAMRSIFSPSRAPEQKTMGLLQRSFLDLANQEGGRLQIAIVVDGTDSMTAELAGVRQSITAMVDDLRRFRGDQVEIALVIYRDQNSPSGPVSIPLKSFSRDTDAIAGAIEKIAPEDGSPFFHELADVGIHAALSELPWSTDPATTRWVMLFGDAPPYDETFQDPNYPSARRRFATELLVALAARKSIRVNCVLCTSDQNVKAPYDKAVDATRTFMNTLALGTDGLMLDLSYPEIRTALIEADRKPQPQYVAIAPITRNDLKTMSVKDAEENAPGTLESTTIDANMRSTTDIRIAILPHLPLDAITFDPKVPAVQVATALRNDFASVPGVRVVNPIELQRQLLRLKADNVSDDQRLRSLAARLGADYVIWGAIQPQGPTVQTAAYRRTDGARVVQVSLKENDATLTKVLLSAASSSPTEKDGALGGLMRRLEASAAGAAINQQLAASDVTRREILEAIEALEQSLGLPAGSEESHEMLNQASKSITAAASVEPRNPLVQWLASNIAYNQAAYYFGRGETAQADAQMKLMGQSLARAFRGRRDVKVLSLATEIEADYLLLVARDVTKAASTYKTMCDPAFPSASRRRAHWMLSGIYAGDWGVDESNVKPELAREHVVALLSEWTESPEAELLRKWMRWDDRAGKTRFSYLPILNRELAKAVPEDKTDAIAP